VTRPQPADDRALWLARADAAWSALARRTFVGCGGRRWVREPSHVRAVALWPFSQVLHAGVSAAAPETAVLLRALESYRRGSAYAERPRGRRRYYDDNAWVGLALLERGHVAEAARLLAFLRQGSVPQADGSIGVRWAEGGESLHACSTGSTGLVALRLAAATEVESTAMVGLALGCTSFLEGLLDADGLVADNRQADGSVDPAVYTYNQALLIGLLVGLGREGEAVAVARHVVAAFDPVRLWAHPPAFNAILVRELLRLDAARPDAGLRAWCTEYLSRVWSEARDPVTGLFTGGGIGHYDAGVVLDHAALTGAMAALASAGAPDPGHTPP